MQGEWTRLWMSNRVDLCTELILLNYTHYEVVPVKSGSENRKSNRDGYKP